MSALYVVPIISCPCPIPIRCIYIDIDIQDDKLLADKILRTVPNMEMAWSSTVLMFTFGCVR